MSREWLVTLEQMVQLELSVGTKARDCGNESPSGIHTLVLSSVHPVLIGQRAICERLEAILERLDEHDDEDVAALRQYKRMVASSWEGGPSRVQPMGDEMSLRTMERLRRRFSEEIL